MIENRSSPIVTLNSACFAFPLSWLGEWNYLWTSGLPQRNVDTCFKCSLLCICVHSDCYRIYEYYRKM